MTVDYKDLLLRYAQAVVDDDHIVGLRCLDPSSAYGPKCDAEELIALVEIFKKVWPEDFIGPYRPQDLPKERPPK